jgi:hypothetical protein
MDVHFLSAKSRILIDNAMSTMGQNSNSNFLDRIRHLFNPLHVYCRLISLGMPSRMAMGICKTYEICLYKPTLGGDGQ